MRRFLMNTFIQAGAGAEQKQWESCPEISTSTNTSHVQQAPEPHLHLESNTQPHQPSAHPCVLRTSHG